MFIKKFSLLGVSLLIVFSIITACSSSNSSSNKSSSSSQQASSSNNSSTKAASAGNSNSNQQIQIRFPWWGDPIRNKKYNKLMDMFEQKYPNVKVIREPMSWNDYWQKIPVETAGGNPPDVLMYTTEGQVYQYIAENAVLPLDNYIKQGKIDISNLNKAMVATGQYNGKQYMLTKGLAAYSILYNVDLLKRAGAPLPKYDMTWDEMVAYLKKIKPLLGKNSNGQQIYPIQIAVDNNLFLESWMRAEGKTLFSADGKSFGFTKQDLINLFTWYKQLLDDGLTPPPDVKAEYANKDMNQDAFGTGRVDMIFEPGNRLKVEQGYLKDKLNLIRFPSINGKHGEVLTGAYLAISSHSKHPDVVANLINIWMNDENFLKVYDNEQGIIPNEKVLNDLKSSMNPDDVIAWNNMKDALNDTVPQPPRVPGMAPINDQLAKSVQEVEYGTKTIPQAVDELFAVANRVLNQGN